MALDNTIGGAAFLLASSTGLITAGAMGPLNVPLGQLGLISLFAAMGALARAFLDAKEARDAAVKDGKNPDQLPQVDLVALGYALLGAPFVGNLAYAIVQYFSLPDFAAVAIIMAMGYLGRDGINAVLSIVRAIVRSRFGGEAK